MPAMTSHTFDDIITSFGQSDGVYGRLELDSTVPVSLYVHQYTIANTGGIYPFLPR